MLDQMSSVFFEEANELLDNLEDQLLVLESDPNNSDTISAVFRAMHTIKGSSAMFGFESISKFTHKIESMYDMVRNGQAPVTKELISLTLVARDHIRDLLGEPDSSELQEKSAKILDEFQSLASGYSPDSSAESASAPQASAALVPEEEEPEESTWRIMFRPSQQIMQNGTRPDFLLKELIDMGNATVVAFDPGLPPLSELDPEKCYFSWDIILTTSHSENDLQDVFIFLDADSSVKIESINVGASSNQKIGEILLARKDIGKEELETLIAGQKKIGQLLVDNNIVSKEQVESALAEQQHLKKLAEAQTEKAPAASAPAASQSVRVSSDKLDQLIDLVGELVTFNARLSQISHDLKNPQLTPVSELSERLIHALRDNAMNMRMLPIGTIFSKFRRLVRDLSNTLNKKIELVTEGAETELDKTVIEKLNDPLIHLIRNSADHGVEMPDVRAAAGKPAQGTVTLTAKHTGAFVLITIKDDGAGINRERVLAKAIEKGLVKPTDNLSPGEINELIFRPGFSTAQTVSDLSGRGVGMDVVKRDIASLGGTVSVESEPGKGSSFILKIPLTLAIVEGMLVEIAGEKYVIPLANVDECIEFLPEDDRIDADNLCSHITSRGVFIPCIQMRNYFNIQEPLPAEQKVVVVNDQNAKIGIVVDKVIGNHQTVIKPIGKLYKNIAGFSGSTILGDGSVALILDIFKLVTVVNRKEQEG